MKSLYEYLKPIFEEDACAATPGGITGMGEPGFSTDGLVSAPVGGIPKQKTTIYRRRRKKKKSQPDFIMNPDQTNKE